MFYDILFCINIGSLLEEGICFKFFSFDFYFKIQQQMFELFYDYEEAVVNIIEIYDKIDKFMLAWDIFLLVFFMLE